MVSGRAALLVELSVCLVCVCCATVSRTCNASPPPTPLGQSKDYANQSAPHGRISSMTQCRPCKHDMQACDVT